MKQEIRKKLTSHVKKKKRKQQINILYIFWVVLKQKGLDWNHYTDIKQILTMLDQENNKETEARGDKR